MIMFTQIFRAIFIVFLCVNLFTWFTTYNSGRAVLGKTDMFFGINGVVLLGLVILFNYLHSRNKARDGAGK